MERELRLHGRSGFTLLEITLVILIIALAMGAIIPLMGIGLGNEALRKTASDFERAAKAARALALASGYPAELRLDTNRFALDAYRIGRSTEGAPDNVTETFKIQSGTAFKIKTWQKPQWRTPKKETWVFQPSGLVEPLTVRFSQGDAYVELNFNPLTGEPDSEKYYFP